MNEMPPERIEQLRAQCRPMEPEPTGVEPSIPVREDIRCVLFDVYGTMLISGTGDVGTAAEANRGEALADALKASGFQLEDAYDGGRGAALLKEEILAEHERRKAEGIEYPEVDIREIWGAVLRRLIEDGRVSGEVSDERMAHLALEYECRINPVWPMPGLLETLDELLRRGLILGIVSNAQFYTPVFFPILLDRTLEALGFNPDLCVWSYRLREAKPSTRLYREALAALNRHHGFTPEQVLYVGNDMLNDVWPAAQTGFRTALFAGDKRSLRWRDGDERVGDTSPDLIVTELRQIPEAVG